ncbi:hypothetical protein ANANG_G00267040, partial [Anguilla anguilla]
MLFLAIVGCVPSRDLILLALQPPFPETMHRLSSWVGMSGRGGLDVVSGRGCGLRHVMFVGRHWEACPAERKGERVLRCLYMFVALIMEACTAEGGVASGRGRGLGLIHILGAAEGGVASGRGCGLRLVHIPGAAEGGVASGRGRGLRLIHIPGAAEGQLAVGRGLPGLVLQQAGHVGVGDAVVVAAEADVVLLQLDGPEGRVQLAVAVLAVAVEPASRAHQQHHRHDDHRQHHHVELRPGHLGDRRRGVVRGAAQTGQQGLRG